MVSTRIVAVGAITALAVMVRLFNLAPVSANASLATATPVNASAEWNITGQIQSMNGQFWDIQGFVVRVTAATNVVGSVPTVGEWASATGTVQVDGTWLATTIRVGDSPGSIPTSTATSTPTSTPMSTATTPPTSTSTTVPTNTNTPVSGQTPTPTAVPTKSATPVPTGRADEGEKDLKPTPVTREDDQSKKADNKDNQKDDRAKGEPDGRAARAGSHSSKQNANDHGNDQEVKQPGGD